MMKNKETIVSFRLSEKNEIYLKELKFLTPETGKKVKNKRNSTTPNLSNFLNQILTYTLETEQHTLPGRATFQELLHAYWKSQTLMLSREYDSLNDKMKYAQARRSEAEMMTIDRENEIFKYKNNQE